MLSKVQESEMTGSIEQTTGKLFGSLWSKLCDDQYCDARLRAASRLKSSP
jgi:hypothetical protein